MGGGREEAEVYGWPGVGSGIQCVEVLQWDGDPIGFMNMVADVKF